ncbi:DUF4765 family protein [Streptomyces sp. NBC_01264]|uniref:DUF4765 family protein n=1 Tax=Streptomyces sp. NBC_01264 TaxID=2903804 RepID=UPI0022577879|nr:DUF4765 family protein [Streptomyces sp. NBC_01264]MCX4784176.1 DUF4765 family protein [Streptomyces sp. NBC_01264]
MTSVSVADAASEQQPSTVADVKTGPEVKGSASRAGARRKVASQRQQESKSRDEKTSEPARSAPPALSSYATVLAAVSDAESRKVIVARGMNADQIARAKNRKANVRAARPTPEQARSQVGEADMGGTVMEFTTDPAVATRFSTWSNEGRKSYFVVVEIDSKYLAVGSTAEQGWISAADAPFKILTEREGRRAL